jgi:hypothetical protein
MLAPARLPAEAFEIDAPGAVEAHTLALEELALDAVSTGLGARADAPLRVDDAVPGNAVPLAEAVQRITHLTRVAAESCEARHLPVGGDATPRNPPDHGEDAPVAVAVCGHGQR